MGNENEHGPRLKQGKRDVLVVDGDDGIFVGTATINVFGEPRANIGGACFSPDDFRQLAEHLEAWAAKARKSGEAE